MALRDEFGGAPDSPVIQYDPVTRVVTLSNPNPGQPWLEVGQSYEIFFPIPVAVGDFGMRSIDGATMDPATRPLGFIVAPPTGTPFVLPKIDFCVDVLPIFRAPFQGTKTIVEGACGSAACHGIPATGGTITTLGLVLNTEEGIRHTAIGVVASETNGTALAGQALPPELVFPTGMPIIDPGNPGNSYLMYKVLANGPAASTGPIPYAACRPTTPPFDYGPTGLADANETGRLSNRIEGERMPWLDPPLTLDELERIRLWIAQGAEVDDCSTCALAPP